MKVHGMINVDVEVTEQEMIATMLANLLKTDKWKLRNMVVGESRDEKGNVVGLYENYDGSYHGTYSESHSLITDDPDKIKKYQLLRDLMKYADK